MTLLVGGGSSICTEMVCSVEVATALILCSGGIIFLRKYNYNLDRERERKRGVIDERERERSDRIKRQEIKQV